MSCSKRSECSHLSHYFPREQLVDPDKAPILTLTNSLENSQKEKLKSVRLLKSMKTWKQLFLSSLNMSINFIVKNQIPCLCYQLDTKPSLKELQRSRRETGRTTSKSFLCTQADKDSKITLQFQKIIHKGLLFRHQTSTKSAVPPNPQTKTSVTLLLVENHGILRIDQDSNLATTSMCKSLNPDNKWRPKRAMGM